MYIYNNKTFSTEAEFVAHMCNTKEMQQSGVHIQIPTTGIFISNSVINNKPILSVIRALTIVTGKGKQKHPFCDYDKSLKKELNRNGYFSFSYGSCVEHQWSNFYNAFTRRGYATFIFGDEYNLHRAPNAPRCVSMTLYMFENKLHSCVHMSEGTLDGNFAQDVAQFGYLHKHVAKYVDAEPGPMDMWYCKFNLCALDEDKVLEAQPVDPRLLLNNYVLINLEIGEVLRIEAICRDVMPKLVPELQYPMSDVVENLLGAIHAYWTDGIYA